MSTHVWKEFDEQEINHSIAHYLMAIHELLKKQGYARVTDVARELEIYPGSVSSMIKKLRSKGWVIEDKNRFLRLSPEGERIATNIEINNRLFVHFLSQVLGVSETQAAIDACKVEHLFSEETREKLLHFLTFMQTDNDAIKSFRKAWQAYAFHCPGPSDCVVCEGEDQCTVEHALSRAKEKTVQSSEKG